MKLQQQQQSSEYRILLRGHDSTTELLPSPKRRLIPNAKSVRGGQRPNELRDSANNKGEGRNGEKQLGKRIDKTDAEGESESPPIGPFINTILCAVFLKADKATVQQTIFNMRLSVQHCDWAVFAYAGSLQVLRSLRMRALELRANLIHCDFASTPVMQTN